MDEVTLIERAVHFERFRRMRCGTCGYQWDASPQWLESFDGGDEVCPECGANCEAEGRPGFWVAPNDPSFDDSQVRGSYWYHTSNDANWPDRDFDPTAVLTDVSKKRYESHSSDGRGLARWATRQKSKAMHLGTYEAAIENMFRRMQDQGNADDSFYLYRVRLRPTVSIKADAHAEPTNFVGDVQLADIGAPDIDVFRYVNTHEDPSSISLAVSINAILAVQVITIPLAADAVQPWVSESSAKLIEAASRPTPLPRTKIERLIGQMPSPLSVEAHNLEKHVADTLPSRLRRRFRIFFDERSLKEDPRKYPSRLLSIAQLVNDPLVALESLDTMKWREV